MATKSDHRKPTYDELLDTISRLEARILELEAAVAKARKNSGNSSKPPSSDIVNPPRPPSAAGKGKRRKRGGQPGHPRHERPEFPQHEIDQFLSYRDDACPCCGGLLEDCDLPPKTMQQVDVVERPIHVVEHQRVAQRCRDCHKVHYVQLPEDLVQAGLAGPRLTALAPIASTCVCTRRYRCSSAWLT